MYYTGSNLIKALVKDMQTNWAPCDLHDLSTICKHNMEETRKKFNLIKITDEWVTASTGWALGKKVSALCEPKLASYLSVRFFSKSLNYFTNMHNHGIIYAVLKDEGDSLEKSNNRMFKQKQIFETNENEIIWIQQGLCQSFECIVNFMKQIEGESSGKTKSILVCAEVIHSM